MGVSGLGSVIKYAMFLFNSVIMVGGCALVGLGIYARTNASGITKFSSILGSNLLPLISFIIIGIGGVVIILSFLGCCGAIKEVKCMLVMFFVLLFLIFVAFVVGGVLAYVFRDKVRDMAVTKLQYQLTNQYGMDGEPAVTESWDYMQTIFECCGVSGGINSTWSWGAYKLHSHWYSSRSAPPVSGVKKANLIIEFVPRSCCRDTDNTPDIQKCQGITERYIIPAVGPPASEAQINDQLFTQGCFTSFENILLNNIIVFICVGAGLVLTMVLGMIFSICLCQCIGRDDYDCEDD